MNLSECVTVRVTLDQEVSRERIADLLCNAFEGGITYWCTRVNVIGDYLGEYAHEQLALGGDIIIWHEEDETMVTVTQAKMLRAFQLMAADYPRHWGDFISDCDDAETADVFFQLCCFGEVVYG